MNYYKMNKDKISQMIVDVIENDLKELLRQKYYPNKTINWKNYDLEVKAITKIIKNLSNKIRKEI